jgi:hypothetical protein
LCAEKTGNYAAGKKYTVSETCVRHWRSIKQKLFQHLPNKNYFSRPRKGRNPEIDASVSEYFKDIRNKGLPITREALMSTKEMC